MTAGSEGMELSRHSSADRKNRPDSSQHRISGTAVESRRIGPRNLAAVLLLDRPEQATRLVQTFRVPIKYRVDERSPGRLRANEVIVTEMPDEAGEFVLLENERSFETEQEMCEAVARQAFPILGPTLYASAFDEAAIRAATAQELAAHAETVERVGVTFGEGAELLRTVRWCFRRTAPGRFEEIDALLADDFLCGLRPLEPEGEGLVHLAFLRAAYRARRIVSVSLQVGLRVRAKSSGEIEVPHRADAYPDEENPMRERRNSAVRWKLSDTDRRALENVVVSRGGRRVQLQRAEDE